MRCLHGYLPARAIKTAWLDAGHKGVVVSFTATGANAFAERARRELQATGETVRNRREDDGTGLTVQEEQIAELARQGRTNPEIGAELFLSTRTVEWHLRKVFSKLEIRLPSGTRRRAQPPQPNSRSQQ